MMNSAFVLDQVRPLASQLLEAGDANESERLRRLYNQGYGRDPSEAEVSRAAGYLHRVRSELASSGTVSAEMELRAWVSLCRAVLSANEFLYVD